MKTLCDPRFLVIYSAVVTIAFAVTLLCGFASPRKAVVSRPRLLEWLRNVFSGASMNISAIANFR